MAGGRGLTLDYGLRWDAQLMPETVDPTDDRVRAVPERSAFPSDGTIPDSKSSSSRASASPGTSTRNGKSVVRGSAGLYYARQNMLSQVGSVTTNGIQQKSDLRSTVNVDRLRRHAGLAEPARPDAGAGGTVPAVHRHPRVRSRLRNPRITTVNVGYERELVAEPGGYADFTYAKGRI